MDESLKMEVPNWLDGVLVKLKTKVKQEAERLGDIILQENTYRPGISLHGQKKMYLDGLLLTA